MCDILEFNIELPNINSNEKITDDHIIEALIENQEQFNLYFLRLIDNGDSRQEITENALRIGEIYKNKENYTVEVLFGYGSYMGCKDMNAEDDYDAVIDFELVDNMMKFYIELPPAWKPM